MWSSRGEREPRTPERGHKRDAYMKSVQQRVWGLGTIAGVSLLTLLAVLVHGYHLGTDDAEIYVPAIKKAADPALYPAFSEFFMSHAHMSLFARVVGDPARLLHLPADAAIFLCYVAGISLLLAAAWRLLCACFESGYARWSGVALLAALLCVPVTATRARDHGSLRHRAERYPLPLRCSPSPVSSVTSTSALRPGCWSTALLHPQMSVYAAVLLACLALARRARTNPVPAFAFGVLPLAQFPFLFHFQPAQGAGSEGPLFAPLLLRLHLGLVRVDRRLRTAGSAVVVLLRDPAAHDARFSARGSHARPFRTSLHGRRRGSVRLTAAGELRALPAHARVPRGLHRLLRASGGLIGEYVLRNRAWRWAALFAPLALSMWLLQRATYPSSSHIEWPGSVDSNPWVSAFLWIRANTPKDAVFALDPEYMVRPGEDLHGFRAIAERSALADREKDSGAASLFPGWRMSGQSRYRPRTVGSGSRPPTSRTWPNGIR